MIILIIKLQAVLTFWMTITMSSWDMVDQVKDYDEHYKDEDNAPRSSCRRSWPWSRRPPALRTAALPMCAHGCWDEDLDHNDEDGAGRFKIIMITMKRMTIMVSLMVTKKWFWYLQLNPSQTHLCVIPEITITVGSVKFQYGNEI